MQAVVGRQKGDHGPRRSVGRPWKLAWGRERDITCSSVTFHRMWCFAREVLARIAPYTFVSHTKMSIVFRKGRSTNYIA